MSNENTTRTEENAAGREASELSDALAPMPAPVRQKATLTFTDNPDGTLGVSMEFEPEVTDDTRSGAVHYAIKCLDHLNALLGGG